MILRFLVGKYISKELIESQDFFNLLIFLLLIQGVMKKITNIMDIIPISTKVLGNIGDGMTHTLTGVHVMLTGDFENSKQVVLFSALEEQLSA